MILLVDYGAGNLRSVCSGFERAGAEVSITTDAHAVREAPLAVIDRKSTRLNSSHSRASRMPSSA